MTEGLRIREANGGDASRIAGLHIRSWRTAYASFMPVAYLDLLDQDGHRLGYWQPLLDRAEPGAQAWIAFWSEVPAGFAFVAPRQPDATGTQAVPEGCGWLEHLHVAPELRGRGLGRPLFWHALAGLHGAGFSEAVLWVYEANTAARAFYERQGWAPDGAEAVKRAEWVGRDGRAGSGEFSMLRYRGPTRP